MEARLPHRCTKPTWDGQSGVCSTKCRAEVKAAAAYFQPSNPASVNREDSETIEHFKRKHGMKNFLGKVVKAQQEPDSCDTIHKKHCQEVYNTEFASLEAMRVGLHKREIYKQIIGAVRTAVQAGSQVLLVCLAGGPITQIEHKQMDGIREPCLCDVRSPKIGHLDAKIDVKQCDLLDEFEAFIQKVADEDGLSSRKQLDQIKGRQRDIDTQYRNVHWRLLDHCTHCPMMDPVTAEDK